MKFSPVILTLVVCVLLAFYPLFLGQFYASGDMRDVFIPIESFFHQEQRLGHMPAWMPDAAFGFTVIASAQIGFFYPLLLVLRFLPVPLYLPLIMIVHAVATAVGTYLFAHKLGQSPWASFFSAISFTLGAFVWQHITHLNIFLAVAWLPWQLLVAKTYSQKKIMTWQGIGLLSLLLGLPFLIGQIQIPVLMAGFTSVYYLFLRSKKAGIKSAFSSLLIIIILMCGLSAAQALPTLELIKYSSRGESGDFDITRANQHSFPLYHLPTLLFPRFYGQDDTYWGKRLEIEYGFFIGTIPLLLALPFAWRTFKNLKASFEPVFFTFVAGVTFLLALGDLSPFRLIGFEPSLWVFSAPARWLLFSSFALSLLAGWGLDTISEKSFLRRKWPTVPVWAIVVGATFFFIKPEIHNPVIQFIEQAAGITTADQVSKITQLLTSATRSSISLLSVFTWLPLIALTITAFTPKRYLLKTILVVSTIELLIVAATTSPTNSWKNIYSTPTALTKLPTTVVNSQARAMTILPGGDTGAFFTDPSSRANNEIRRQQKNALVPLINTQFHIPGVSWPASLDIQAVTQALSETPLEQLGSLNIASILYLDTQSTVNNVVPRASLLDPSTSKETPVIYTSSQPNSLEINIDAPQDSQLIVRDTWYPGWQATVDGKATPIEQTGPHNIFRSLNVSAGKHVIQMSYEPIRLSISIALTIMTFLISCAMLVLKNDL